jgi:hypothetical protein
MSWTNRRKLNCGSYIVDGDATAGDDVTLEDEGI